MGRDPSVEIQLDDPSVSRVHLVIDGTGDGWRLSDQASKNGTRIDGRPIPHQTILTRRCWLGLGGVPVLAEPLTDADGQEPLPASNERLAELTPPETDRRPPDSADELLAGSLDAVRTVTGCDRAGLWLVGPDALVSEARILGDRQLPISRSVVQRAASTGEAVFCSDTRGAQQLAQHESIVSGGIRAVIAIPLEAGEGRRGVIYADSQEPGKLFTEHDADLLESIASQVTLALASQRIGLEIRTMIGNRDKQP